MLLYSYTSMISHNDMRNSGWDGKPLYTNNNIKNIDDYFDRLYKPKA